MIRKIETLEDIRREFDKIENPEDLSQWAENLQASGLLRRDGQVKGISLYSIPRSATNVWDNGENCLVEFKKGHFALWLNSERKWRPLQEGDENPLFHELDRMIRDASIEITKIDSNDDYRSTGWINTRLTLRDKTIIEAGFRYKTPFRDPFPFQAVDETRRETRPPGVGWKGDDDIDMQPYHIGELGKIDPGKDTMYSEEHIKVVWSEFPQARNTGYKKAYTALFEKIRDSLMKELEKAETWLELEAFLPS